MNFEKSLWTADEKRTKRIKMIIVGFVIVVILTIVSISFYIKKTSTNTVSTDEGLKRLEKLEKQNLKDTQNIIEDRRNARDKEITDK